MIRTWRAPAAGIAVCVVAAASAAGGCGDARVSAVRARTPGAARVIEQADSAFVADLNVERPFASVLETGISVEDRVEGFHVEKRLHELTQAELKEIADALLRNPQLRGTSPPASRRAEGAVVWRAGEDVAVLRIRRGGVEVRLSHGAEEEGWFRATPELLMLLRRMDLQVGEE